MATKKKLIERLAKQLEFNNPEKVINVDSFSDGSASWIEIKPKVMDIKKGYSIVEVLSFNGRGTELESVKCYKEVYTIHSESEIIK